MSSTGLTIVTTFFDPGLANPKALKPIVVILFVFLTKRAISHG